jgi:DNA-binding transcriptional regulator YhcF (GntR family)
VTVGGEGEQRMAFGLGPRANRVYESLRRSIAGGELPPGTKLPAHTALAQQYGVAPLTMRMVLGRLEARGLVSREQGRGTFVRARTAAAVVLLAGDEAVRAQLSQQIADAGYRPVVVGEPREALGAIERDPTVALVLTDLHTPDQRDGLAVVRAVRRRWPDLALAVITRAPADLAGLHGTRESPALLLTQPFSADQVAELLRLALPPPVEQEAEEASGGRPR